jgi:hypothetical protein
MATDGLAPLEASPHHDMVLRAPWTSAMAMVLLHGDDPYLELPIPDAILASRPSQTELEVELGWPMSSDFMALAEVVHPLEQQITEFRNRASQSEAHAARSDAIAVRASRQAEELKERQLELSEELSVLSERLATSMTHNQRLVEEYRAMENEQLELNKKLAALERDREQLLALTE